MQALVLCREHKRFKQFTWACMDPVGKTALKATAKAAAPTLQGWAPVEANAPAPALVPAIVPAKALPIATRPCAVCLSIS